MTIHRVKLSELTRQQLQHLQEQYAGRDVEVDIKMPSESALPASPFSMNEDKFWDIIASLDWSKEGNDDAVIEPDGLSKRLRNQLDFLNRAVGLLRFVGNILLKNIAGRAKAKEIEDEYIDRYIEQHGRRPRGNPTGGKKFPLENLSLKRFFYQTARSSPAAFANVSSVFAKQSRISRSSFPPE